MRGSRNLAACFFGEGAAAEGEFHESMNLAALWKLPVLFLCENNLYAMGTALARSESQTDIQAKAAAYAMRAEAVDGMDVFAVESAVRSAADHARAGRGPVLLEFRTYRLRAHSMFDAQLYRDKAEVEEWRGRGPLSSLTTRLKAAGLMTEDDFQRLLREADEEVQRAVQFATAAPCEPVQELGRHVCAERVPS
jgi:pyruvate dehydrogenase E1 component alpha subunit